MKLGIELDWQSRHFHVPLERLKLADRIGYDVVFTAELNGSDALTPLGYVLGVTERIGLGTHIAQTVGRSPTGLAMAYQTLRHMAGPEREIIAGLGSAGPRSTMAWHGQPWTPPYKRMRDWVAVMHQTFRGEVVEYQGPTVTIPHADAGHEYEPYEPLLETDPSIPVIFGGGTELMLTLAAEIADGLMPLSYAPGMMEVYRPMIEKGFSRRKNPPKFEDFPIWTHCDVMLTDDVKEAMGQFKQYVARYAGGWTLNNKSVNVFANQLIWRGYGEVQKRVEELYLAGHIDEAEAAVPDELIDEGWLFGPMPRILERWKSHWIDKGVNLIVRTDNWPTAERAGDDVYEPLIRAARG